MYNVIKIVPTMLYIFIGIISLIMAFKCLFSTKFLPFHEAAYGKSWENVEKNLQYILIALLKISGLGFLTVTILLLTSPIANYFEPTLYLKFGIPMIALIFCTGLFIVNLKLFRQTHVKTPWKNSLFIMFVIVLSILISII